MKGQVSIEFIALLSIALLASSVLITELNERAIEYNEAAPYSEAQKIAQKTAYTVDYTKSSNAEYVDLAFTPSLEEEYNISLVSGQVEVEFDSRTASFPVRYNGPPKSFDSDGRYRIGYDEQQNEILIIGEGNEVEESLSIAYSENFDLLNLAKISREKATYQGLLGYWRMDDAINGDGGTVTDYSGKGNNGTALGGVNTDVKGVFGSNSSEFDYSDQEYVDHPDLSTQFDDEATISLWLKRSDVNTPSNSDATGLFNYGYNQNNDRSHYPWTDGNLYLSTFADDRKVDGLDNTDFNKTKWHHLLITTSPGINNYEVYQNGTLIAERNGPSSVSLPSNMRFGYSDSNYYFNGKMDEVRLYNRSLSQEEVEELYVKGVPYQGSYTTKTVENSDPQNWNTLEVEASIPSLTELNATFETLQDSLIFNPQQIYSGVDDWNRGAFNKTTGDETPLELENVSEFEASTQADFNQGEFNRTSADRKNNSGDLGVGYRNGSTGDDLVGYWRLDTDSLEDYSGEGNNGSLNGGIITSSQGIFSSNSYRFDGTDDYGVVPNDASFEIGGSDFTTSAWVNYGSIKSNHQTILSHRHDYLGSGYPGYDFLITRDTGKIRVVVEDSSNLEVYDSNTEIPTDQWVLLTAVFDRDGNVQFYLNRSKDGSGDISAANGDISNGRDLRIGGQENDTGSITDYFDGNIDEIKIYNKSLTQEEVKNLYFNGRPFQGNYTAKKIDNSQETSWNKLEVNTSIPSDTSVNATFKALDTNGDLVDSQQIDLNEGLSNYSLNVNSSKDAGVFINGTSSNVTKTWEIHALEVFSSEVEDKTEGLRIGYRNGSTGDDLVGYWRFDRNVSGSGGTVKDYSGYGNEGTTMNAVEFGSPGVFSSGLLDLSGDAEYVGVPEKSLKNFTVSLFARYDGLNSDGDESDMVISNGGAKGDFIQTSTSTSNGHGLRLAIGGDSQRVTWSGLESAGIEENLTHIVVVKEGNSVRAYIDGEDKGSKSLSDNYNFTFDTVGADWADKDRSRYSFNGLIDEVRFHNRSLSESEITSHYFNGRPFQGNYTAEKIDNSQETSWEKVEINASVPSGTSPPETNLTAEFEALDSNNNLVDREYISIDSGSNTKNYSLSVQASENARLSFNGTSSNVSKSWNVYDYEIFSGEREVDQSESFDVQEGLNNYSLSLGSSQYSRLRFNGASNYANRSWSVERYTVFANN